MSQSPMSLKAFCKKNKVKMPKTPFMFKSYDLQDMRRKIIDYLRNKVDSGGGCITVKIPMDNSDGSLFSENGGYFFSSDKLGKHALNDLSIGFLGEQLYYSLEKENGSWSPGFYENRFDEIEGLEEEWMHCIISNKEKRIALNTGVPLLFSGYTPGQMAPGTITEVYEKEGEHYVCVDGQDDIYWFDLNIETKVALCEELYKEFIPQVTPKTIEDALMLIALEDKSKSDRASLAYQAGTPVSILSILCEDKNKDVRAHVARNRNATPEILSKLSEDTDTEVRQYVAENLNTPADCLAKLAEAKEVVIDFGYERDLCDYIRLAVARNPNTPVESLVKLTEDSFQNVSYSASKTLKQPSWCLEGIDAYHESSQDKQATDSSIPDIPADMLAQMANDPDYHVRAKAAENPNTPADCLVRLSKDNSWDVVEKVANNPSFPLEVLMAYANDEKMMRFAVENPSFPLSTLLEFAQAACYYPKSYPTDAIIRSLLNRIDSN